MILLDDCLSAYYILIFLCNILLSTGKLLNIRFIHKKENHNIFSNYPVH